MTVWEVEWYLNTNINAMKTKIFSNQAAADAFAAQLNAAMAALELDNVGLVVEISEHDVLD